MPDIDIDFQDDRRKEVLEYCTEKYGYDHIAQIIAFSKNKSQRIIKRCWQSNESTASIC